MRDDITPLSSEDPESGRFSRERPPWLKGKKRREEIGERREEKRREEGKREEREGKAEEQDKKPKKRSATKERADTKEDAGKKEKKPLSAKEKQAEERAKKAEQRYRREQLKEKEKSTRRGDLVFFWVVVSLLIIGSILIGSYLYLRQRANQPVTEEPTSKAEEQLEESIVGENNYFLFLSATDERATIYKDYLVAREREAILSFSPPPTMADLDADWDNDHRYAFIDNKGVEIYNSENKSKSVLAPNQGDREYFQVKFSANNEIATLYRKNNLSYLELYSSSLRKIGRERPVTSFNWTKRGESSYVLVDHQKKQYQFQIFNSQDQKYQSYFSDYFGFLRYPIIYQFSPQEDKIAFLLRDNQSNESKVILAIGSVTEKRISKIAELLYLENTVEDSEIARPTLVWDQKEDFIYASLNNRIFKVDLITNEAEELNLGFYGTGQLLSPDRKELYIRKSNDNNSSQEINRPESVVVYNLSKKEVVYSSPLSQIVKFIAYHYLIN
jgi:hypothetical protein